jgi:hypothetical protein
MITVLVILTRALEVEPIFFVIDTAVQIEIPIENTSIIHIAIKNLLAANSWKYMCALSIYYPPPHRFQGHRIYEKIITKVMFIISPYIP